MRLCLVPADSTPPAEICTRFAGVAMPAVALAEF
jgi:hypothetical protein